MSAPAPALTLMARAKFNIRLEIGDRRPDGLHEIRSVIASLLIGDEISFSPSDAGFSVTCDDPSIAMEDNLAWRAARALDIPLPAVHVHVGKTLPSQAGLGGGSADAATTLRGLARLLRATGVTLRESDLQRAARAAGADVAACLKDGIRVVEGSGDVVHQVPVHTPPWGVLLLKPAIGIPTADAYRILDEARARQGASPTPGDPPIAGHTASEALCDALAANDFGQTCAYATNAFQSVIEEAYPDVGEARRRLVSAGAAATLLCGSGSCVAGLFETVVESQRALALVRPRAGEWAAATGFAHEG